MRVNIRAIRLERVEQQWRRRRLSSSSEICDQTLVVSPMWQLQGLGPTVECAIPTDDYAPSTTLHHLQSPNYDLFHQ